MSAYAAMESLDAYTDAVIKNFGEEYRRKHTNDLQLLNKPSESMWKERSVFSCHYGRC